jgi:hypothetical protein
LGLKKKIKDMKNMKILKTYEAFLGGEQKSILPKPAETDIITYEFKVPVRIQGEFDDSVFSYYSDIDEIARKIENEYGVDASWLPDQFNQWKEYRVDDPGEEPDEDDFENEDDYEAELEDWNERKEEYDKINDHDDADLLYDFAKDELGGWDKFVKEFEVDGLIDDIVDRREQEDIHKELKDDFNESELVQYFDKADELGVIDMKVVDDRFENGKFTIAVTATKELSEEELAEVEDYISGQCSDGWGEGFEQQDIEGYSVSAWWNDDNKYGEYKIDIEKQ